MSPEELELHTYLELECLAPSPNPWSNSKPLALGKMLTNSAIDFTVSLSSLLSNKPRGADDLRVSQAMSNQDLKF